MRDHPLLPTLEELRVFAVIRTRTTEQAIAAARACLRGGIRLIEITLTVPRAFEAVMQLQAEPQAIVGVGSVINPLQVREAAQVGARFAVSPHFDADVLAETQSQGLLSSMGGVTPTEMMNCHRAGVDVIKIFPAASFGGPTYLKAILEPLPFLRLMPTRGVEESNIQAYFDAGAFSVGLGGTLVDSESIAAARWDAVEARAKRLVSLVTEWKTLRERPPTS